MKSNLWPDVGILPKLFSCDLKTGQLHWRVRPCQRMKAGDIAGYIRKDGYRSVLIKHRQVFCHRIIWAMAHGRWPVEDIDHINGIRNDNRIDNLREASRSQNAANSRLPASNTSGLKGVYATKTPGRWIAQIGHEGQKIYLGRFNSPEDARSAYVKAAETLFGEFARTA